MRILIVFAIGLLMGCAAKEKKSMVEKEPPKAEPLAKYVEIAISLREPNGNVAEVRRFYEKLGFVAIEEGGPPVPFVVLSDGVIHLRLDECEFATPRLDYYTADAPKQVARLQELGISVSTEMACARKTNVTNFSDPNGQQLALIQRDHAPVAGPRKSTSLCGNFGEFSIHTNDRDASLEWYRKLGFEVTKFEKPYPWAILRDGNILIGLHQSTEFTKTTLTYFSKDSAQRIEKLKAMGLKFTNEQKNQSGKVANAVLEAPDGQMFFVFEE
jgi:predicted enzyme related to lactoylglutathione lyase